MTGTRFPPSVCFASFNSAHEVLHGLGASLTSRFVSSMSLFVWRSDRFNYVLYVVGLNVRITQRFKSAPCIPAD